MFDSVSQWNKEKNCECLRKKGNKKVPMMACELHVWAARVKVLWKSESAEEYDIGKTNFPH